MFGGRNAAEDQQTCRTHSEDLLRLHIGVAPQWQLGGRRQSPQTELLTGAGTRRQVQQSLRRHSHVEMERNTGIQLSYKICVIHHILLLKKLYSSATLLQRHLWVSLRFSHLLLISWQVRLQLIVINWLFVGGKESRLQPALRQCGWGRGVWELALPALSRGPWPIRASVREQYGVWIRHGQRRRLLWGQQPELRWRHAHSTHRIPLQVANSGHALLYMFSWFFRSNANATRLI